MSNPDYYDANLKIIGIRVSELEALRTERDRYREELQWIGRLSGESCVNAGYTLDEIYRAVQTALAGAGERKSQ